MKQSIKLLGIMFSAVLALAAAGCSTTKPEISEETLEVVEQTGQAVTESQTEPATTTLETTTTHTTTKPHPLTSNTTCTTVTVDAVSVELLLNQMTLEEKIYQMFMVTPEGLTGFYGNVTEAGEMTKNALEKYPVGGIVYFSPNIESWSQTKDMLARSQDFAQEQNHGIGLFLAVDEEGGSVARLSEKLGLYSCYDMEHYGDNLDYSEVYNVGSTIGTVMGTLGFNIDFAPVADININPNNELGSRIFSSSPQVVSDMTSKFVAGLEETGISATLKHFPGLGAGDGNTHDNTVRIDRSYNQLLSNEFMAFQGGIVAGADFVMVGHQITAGSEDNRPGDLSKVVVTDWLKGTLGFTGLVITDAQNMGAIVENYAPGRAAVEAIKAGVDIVLMPYDLANAADGVLLAVQSGEIPESRISDSVRKILTKKVQMGVIDLPTEPTTTTYQQYSYNWYQ